MGEGTHIDSDQKEIAKEEEKDSVRWADPAGSHSGLQGLYWGWKFWEAKLYNFV